MQHMVIMPVANGVLPRPHGGKITGMFIMECGGQVLHEVGIGRDIMICPWNLDNESMYPVGVIARIMDINSATAQDEQGTEINVLTAVLEGREHARWHTLKTTAAYVCSEDIELLNLRDMRTEYPVISGAGWMPLGGYTEFRSQDDIPVTVYGTDLESGQEISISANLGGLVEQEHAHTIEHAIIRSLTSYGLCTARTLAQSMARETTELKKSVEQSIRWTMPEMLGMTQSGICGNPMTNLAQFYLAKKFVDNVHMGKSLNESILQARRTAMSRLTQDLGLTMQSGVRVLQGLKKGMSHDDTPLKLEVLKKVIGRFPFEPWS